jgi:hypothetical protein
MTPSFEGNLPLFVVYISQVENPNVEIQQPLPLPEQSLPVHHVAVPIFAANSQQNPHAQSTHLQHKLQHHIQRLEIAIVNPAQIARALNLKPAGLPQEPTAVQRPPAESGTQRDESALHDKSSQGHNVVAIRVFEAHRGSSPTSTNTQTPQHNAQTPSGSSAPLHTHTKISTATELQPSPVVSAQPQPQQHQQTGGAHSFGHTQTLHSIATVVISSAGAGATGHTSQQPETNQHHITAIHPQTVPGAPKGGDNSPQIPPQAGHIAAKSEFSAGKGLATAPKETAATAKESLPPTAPSTAHSSKLPPTPHRVESPQSTRPEELRQPAGRIEKSAEQEAPQPSQHAQIANPQNKPESARRDIPLPQENRSAIPLPDGRNENVIPAYTIIGAPNYVNYEPSKGSKGGGKGKSKEAEEQRLGDLLFMISSAALEGAATLDEVMQSIEQRSGWLKKALNLTAMPARQVIWALLAALDPTTFDKVVIHWLQQLAGQPSPVWNVKHPPVLPHIYLWESPIGLLFGQLHSSHSGVPKRCVDQLLTALNLRQGLLITHTDDNPELLAQAIDRRGGYYLAESDSPLDSELIAPAHSYESYVEGSDYIHLQRWRRAEQFHTSSGIESYFHVSVEQIQGVNRRQLERYYLSNLEAPPAEIFDMLRLQRPLENKVEWLLNFSFHAIGASTAAANCRANLQLYAHHSS